MSRVIDGVRLSLGNVERPSEGQIQETMAEQRLSELVPFFEKIRDNCFMPLEVVDFGCELGLLNVRNEGRNRYNLAVVAGSADGHTIYYADGNFWSGRPEGRGPAVLNKPILVTEEIGNTIMSTVEAFYSEDRPSPVRKYRNMHPLRFIQSGGNEERVALRVGLTGEFFSQRVRETLRDNIKDIYTPSPGLYFAFGDNFERMLSSIIYCQINPRYVVLTGFNNINVEVYYRNRWNIVQYDVERVENVYPGNYPRNVRLVSKKT